MSSAGKRKEREHALARARERYGVRLSHEDYERLVAQIANGEAPEIERHRTGGTIHLVRHNQTRLLALYRDLPQRITTFLPRHLMGA